MQLNLTGKRKLMFIIAAATAGGIFTLSIIAMLADSYEIKNFVSALFNPLMITALMIIALLFKDIFNKIKWSIIAGAALSTQMLILIILNASQISSTEGRVFLILLAGLCRVATIVAAVFATMAWIPDLLRNPAIPVKFNTLPWFGCAAGGTWLIFSLVFAAINEPIVTAIFGTIFDALLAVTAGIFLFILNVKKDQIASNESAFMGCFIGSGIALLFALLSGFIFYDNVWFGFIIGKPMVGVIYFLLSCLPTVAWPLFETNLDTFLQRRKIDQAMALQAQLNAAMPEFQRLISEYMAATGIQADDLVQVKLLARAVMTLRIPYAANATFAPIDQVYVTPYPTEYRVDGQVQHFTQTGAVALTTYTVFAVKSAQGWMLTKSPIETQTQTPTAPGAGY